MASTSGTPNVREPLSNTNVWDVIALAPWRTPSRHDTVELTTSTNGVDGFASRRM